MRVDHSAKNPASRAGAVRADRIEFALTVLLLVIFFVAAFHPLLSSDFVYWDDRALITANPAVLNFDLTAIFTGLDLGGYFPVTQLSLALDHLAAGVSPTFMHAENLLLHALNSFLVFLFVRKIFAAEPLTGVTTAALFALHPLNTEAVAWVSGGRKDLLCTFFYLASILAFARYADSLRDTPSGRKVAFGLVTFVMGCLALLSKAMAYSLPVALPLFGRVARDEGAPPKSPEVAAPRLRMRFHPAMWLPSLALLPVVLICAYFENLAQRTAEHISSLDFSLWRGLLRTAESLFFWLTRPLAPHKLAVFYDPSIFRFDWLDGAGAVLFAVLIGTIAVTGLSARRQAWAGLIFYFLALAPVLKFIPFGAESPFNNRYFYLPGIGLISFICVGLADLRKGLFSRSRLAKSSLLATKLFLFIVLADLSLGQARAWENQEMLWLRVLDKYPGSLRAYKNLSLFYTENGRYPKALEMFKAALALEPRDRELRANLGVLYTRMALYEDAEKTYVDLLRDFPQDSILQTNLAYVYFYRENFPSAKARFAAALSIDPNFFNAVIGLADTLVKTGDSRAARDLLMQAKSRLGERPDLKQRLHALEVP